MFLTRNENTGIWYFYNTDDGKALKMLDSNGNYLNFAKDSTNPSDRDVDQIVTVESVPEGFAALQCTWSKDSGFQKYTGSVTPTNNELLAENKALKAQVDDLNKAIAELVGAE